MKNKTSKNLIALGVLAVLFVFTNSVSADTQYYNNPYYSTYENNISNRDRYNAGYYGSTTYQNNYGQQNPNSYVQPPVQYAQQPYTFVQPQTQYIQQPTQPQIQYVQVPSQPQIQYVQVPAATQQIRYVQQQPVQTVVSSNNQAASVARANTTTTKTYANSGTNSNTGAYINYDGNNPNLLAANAYGGYNNQSAQQVVTNGNDLTALSIKGSGGFMPTSVFQWFLVILLILAIVIIARMVSKTFSNGSHAAPAH